MQSPWGLCYSAHFVVTVTQKPNRICIETQIVNTETESHTQWDRWSDERQNGNASRKRVMICRKQLDKTNEGIDDVSISVRVWRTKAAALPYSQYDALLKAEYLRITITISETKEKLASFTRAWQSGFPLLAWFSIHSTGRGEGRGVVFALFSLHLAIPYRIYVQAKWVWDRVRACVCMRLLLSSSQRKSLSVCINK